MLPLERRKVIIMNLYNVSYVQVSLPHDIFSRYRRVIDIIWQLSSLLHLGCRFIGIMTLSMTHRLTLNRVMDGHASEPNHSTLPIEYISKLEGEKFFVNHVTHLIHMRHEIYLCNFSVMEECLAP
jgi:hypothetical protein